MFATTGAQAVALFAVLSAASTTVNAFSPVFSTPRQCDSLKITWSSMEIPASTHGLTEFTMSLVPLDDPKHHTPSPYMLTVPCTMLDDEGVLEVPALPFKAGTQFFASAHFPGTAGPVRRMVSEVFTVEHSTDASCLDTAVPPNAKRPRVKTFGKRQVNVIGATSVGASAAPASSSAAAAVPINVIGVSAIPSGEAGSSQAASSTSGATTLSFSAPAASSSSGAVPPIRVIGSSNVPASGSGNPDTPANAAPAPAASSTGPVPPINVVGPGVIPVNGGASSSTTSASEGAPTTIVVDNGTVVTSETSTPCTETQSSTTAASESTMTGMPMDDNYDDSEEEPCEDEMSSSMDHGMPASTTTRANAAINTEVVHYDSFDDMVNAANSAFHAWNPYGPAYTRST